MPDETKIYQLIVRQLPADGPELDDLLQALQRRLRSGCLYRQPAAGWPWVGHVWQGPPRENRGNCRCCCISMAFACWQIEPSLPGIAPIPSAQPAKSITNIFCSSARMVWFVCSAATQVVGVLADLSGGLVDKHVKRLLAQNTYRGRDAVELSPANEMIPDHFPGQAGLRFLPARRCRAIRKPFRVLPGRFNVDWLRITSRDEHQGQPCRRCLLWLRSMHGLSDLHCDFGLSQLPDCQVERLVEEPSAAIENTSKA